MFSLEVARIMTILAEKYVIVGGWYVFLGKNVHFGSE